MNLRSSNVLHKLPQRYYPPSSQKTPIALQTCLNRDFHKQTKVTDHILTSFTTRDNHVRNIASKRNKYNSVSSADTLHPSSKLRKANQRSVLAYSTSPALSLSQNSTISTGEYHKLADAYIDMLVGVLEELQEKRHDVDCEYSAGVLTLKFPPSGTYVLNKQPPNKQIWLSSPISGPKRYDYVIKGGNDGDKAGQWVYHRDHSSLSRLLESELGILIEGNS